jgi:flagellar biosynthetic protein FliP
MKRKIAPPLQGEVAAPQGLTEGYGRWRGRPSIGASRRHLPSGGRIIARIAAAVGALAALTLPLAVRAQTAVPGALDRAFGDLGGAGGEPLSLSLQLLLVMGLLTILPALILMMTSFTRILVVLAILRQALGLQQSPPNQVLIGLSLFLSLFVMAPTLERVNDAAIAPYSAGQINAEQAIAAAGDQFHAFMIRQTRDNDLEMFADIANAPDFASPADVPFSILLPAFVTSELKTAFQIGFMLFLPFLVIDLVVSSVLMSLGMMMMSPMMVSLPFKLLLFVLVDGWALLMGSLASSFG